MSVSIMGNISCKKLAENIEASSLPSEKIIPSTTLNPVIPMTSLRAAPAMRNVGIPPSTPNPLSCKYKRDGTTTAGDTAHNANLKKSGK